jgi:hypothetical protein
VYREILSFLDSHLHLSKLSFFIFAPFSIAAAPFAFSFRANAPSIASLLILGCAITVPTLIFYLFILLLIKKYIPGNSTLINLSALSATGIFRGLIFYYLVDLLGMQNPSPLLGRLLNSTYTVVFWVGLVSILVESNRRFKRRYRALLTQILILKLRNSESPDPGYALIAQQIARMQLKIKSTIQDRESDQTDAIQAASLASTLRDEIVTVIKPLSQRLWVKSVFAPPSAKLSNVISTAITELQYPFRLTAILYGCANVINTTQSLGFFAGIVYGGSTFVVFLFLEKVRVLGIYRFSSKSGYINTLFVASIGLLVGLSTNGVFRFLNLDYSFAVAVLSAPSLPFLIISIAVIKMTLEDRKSLVDILSKKVSKIKKEEIDAVAHGDAAAYLHNSLQSELFALALHLDKLADNPDPQQNRFLMEKLDALVSQSKSEDFKNFLETPQVRLDRIVNSWDGIAKVHLNLEVAIWNDAMRSSLVVSLLQEAIANAVRSGHASQVEVRGTIDGDSIIVSISDNGSATLQTERRGIGSQWIDRIAISDWKLEQSETGRVLRVEI